jgi:ubiquinone/menaquinone biosynthesis C-methylase UbiE
MPASAFDTAAPEFDRHRALPDGVPEQIRSAVLAASATSSNPAVLDLGAGSGRIGRPFVAAGDRYVGVDLSFGMLHEFMHRTDAGGRTARMAQCDGESLPFRDGTFDVVLLVSVVGGARGWRRIAAEARRVLRTNGALVIGKTVAPPDGIDAQLKERLAAILEELGFPAEEKQTGKALSWLESVAAEKQVKVAASWTSGRSPRGFLDRKPTGAKFSELPVDVRDEALRRLTGWATSAFGSLEAVSPEAYAFELTIFRFSGE